ncbi:MAG: DUF1080 domain-containing protein [Planctomycetota bacterium]
MKAARFVFACMVVVGLATRANAEVISLFNGKDLTGWTYFLSDKSKKMEDVWSVKDGVLVCKGNPAGYIRTEKEYENYVLSLEWRWPEGTKKGSNNGVLVHTTTPSVLGVWPKSIEAQLAEGNAGDIWVIGTTIKIDNPTKRKFDRRHLNLTDNSEKSFGEWNKYVLVCVGNTLTLIVNGDVVNYAWDLSDTKGAISLQSEGAPIEFRNIVLRTFQ